MHYSTILVSLLAAFATAAPVDVEIAERQIGNNVGTTSNEYTRSGCRKVIFFFARGSTEVGNMVSASLDSLLSRTY